MIHRKFFHFVGGASQGSTLPQRGIQGGRQCKQGQKGQKAVLEQGSSSQIFFYQINILRLFGEAELWRARGG
jgi:hypothetical protein